MPDEAETRPPRPIFAVFDGGGAKRVAHVGAPDAIAANNLEIIGVAGTSAGALAAVLAAIGLEAADIMDAQDPQANILSRNGVGPMDLLGSMAWREFCYLRDAGTGFMKRSWALKAILGVVELSQALSILIHASRRRGHFTTHAIPQFVTRVVGQRLQEIKDTASTVRFLPSQLSATSQTPGPLLGR